jgi:glycosyltransferase involved in cell wall biosynthesis
MPTETRILTVYYKHKPGGFCKRLQMKIHAYLEQGWKVHYIAVEPFPYKHKNLTPHILTTPFKIHDTLFFWIYFFALAPWFTAWIAYREKVQLLSIFSLTYACLCAPAKWVTGAPLLTFIRTLKEKKEFSFGRSQIIFMIERLMEKAGVAISDSLVANSESIKVELAKLGNTKKDIQILYNNINELNIDKAEQRKWVLKEFELQEDSFLVVTTGLLIPRKNLHCFLKAVAKVESNKVVLILIGQGPLLHSLQVLAKQLELKVIFTGWREDVLDILPGCDLFVFPSHLEGLSNSILEAMACGLPCLVSDISENREIISRPEQRFPVNQAETLTAMINGVLHSNEKLEIFRNSTVADRKRFIFNWEEKIIKKAEEVIKRSPKAH